MANYQFTLKEFTPEQFRAKEGNELFPDSDFLGKVTKVYEVVPTNPEEEFECTMFFCAYGDLFYSICYNEDKISADKHDCAEWIYRRAKI